MRPTERSARKPSLKTGLLAALRGLLHARGSGAPSRPRALAPAAVLAVALGALAFMSAPALALVPPETPETPETQKAESASESGATLRGVLNPGKAGGAGLFEIDTYEFIYNKASAGEECKGGAKTEPEGMSLGGGMEQVAQAVTGLEAHTKYLVCLVASNGTEAVGGAPVSFVTAPVEAPEQEEAVNITGSSAELKGLLNPKAKSEGETGGYAFRYSFSGSECEVGGATSTAGGGEMTGAPEQAVSTVVGLQPETTYTFCLVATQPGEEAKGSPVTFTTPALAPAISGESTAEGESSVGSNEATVEAHIVPGAPPAKYYVEYGTSTAYGSSTTAVGLGTGTSPVRVEVRIGGLQPKTEYHYRFAAENEAGIKEVGEDKTFTTPASAIGSITLLPDNRAYELVSSPTENITVENAADGLGLEVVGDTSCYTGKEHAAAGGDAIAYQAEPSIEGGNGQFGDGLCNQWIAVRGPSGWKATDVQPADEPNADFSSLYEAVGGSLAFTNPLPEGRPESAYAAWLGGPPSEVDQGAKSPDFTNAISSDGSRVFWTSAEVSGGKYIPRKLYVEENATQPPSPLGPGGECTVAGDACPVEVDAGEAKCVADKKCEGGGGLYWTATVSGSKVFFTDAKRLTANSTAEPEEPDLYEYEVATGRITDLTVSGAGPANVSGVIGVGGENGEYIYFGAKGVLASNESVNGETARQIPRLSGYTLDKEANLYVLHNGVTTFLTVYRGERFGNNIFNEEMSDLSRGPNFRTASVSSDGRTMMFESDQQLLPNYEGSGVELYVYDASTERIVCASCDPTGAPQHSSGEGLLPASGGAGGEIGRKIGWPSYGALRSMSASGARIFFDSEAALVPQDTNGLRDVYEWERPASGSEPNNTCSKSSASYSEINGGCVYLLSGGQTRDASYFVDADVEGNNVFFDSRGRLVPQAEDENIALYDARVGGGFLELKTSCTGTGCQGVPPAPPIFATPASVTYEGVGNFEPQPPTVEKVVVKSTKCKKGEVRKSGRCVKAKGSGRSKRSHKRAKRRKK
jgi:hypothetical protein